MISYMCDSIRNISNFFRKCFEMNGVRKAISPLSQVSRSAKNQIINFHHKLDICKFVETSNYFRPFTQMAATFKNI